MNATVTTRVLVAIVFVAVLGGATTFSPPLAADPAGRGPVVVDDVVTAAETVAIASEVQGDVAAAGTRVSITGPVSGYVMSAGRNVSIDGSVGNDLWVAGETVGVSSAIANNVMAAGRTVRVEPESTIGHDASLAGNNVAMAGRVDRNLRIKANSAQIGGEVGGNVRASARHVTILPDAVIRGDLLVASPEPPFVSPQAQVLGSIRYEATEPSGTWMTWPWMWLTVFVSLLVVGIMAVAFAPAWAGRVAYTMRMRTGRSFIIGLLWLVVAPVVIGLLLVTVIGIPLAVLLLASYAILVVFSGVFVAYSLGSWLLDRQRVLPSGSPWPRLGLGVAIVSLGMSLPFVGWFVALVVVFFGVGALLLERRTPVPMMAG